MIPKIKDNILTIFLALVVSTAATGRAPNPFIEEASAPQNFTGKSRELVRIYCYHYHPDNGQVVRTKLVDSESNQTQKFNATWVKDSHAYVMDESQYLEAFQACQNLNDGQTVYIKATPSASYESVALRLYGTSEIKVWGSDGQPTAEINVSKVHEMAERSASAAPLAQKAAQTRWNTFNQSEKILVQDKVIEILSTHKDVLESIEAELQEADDATIREILASFGHQTLHLTGKHGPRVAAVALTLALLWFQAPLVSEGVRMIFPYVYAAMYGSVPSQLSIEYWWSYLPMLSHVSNLAYRYSGLPIAGMQFAFNGAWALSSGLSGIIARIKGMLPQNMTAPLSAEAAEEEERILDGVIESFEFLGRDTRTQGIDDYNYLNPEYEY